MELGEERQIPFTMFFLPSGMLAQKARSLTVDRFPANSSTNFCACPH